MTWILASDSQLMSYKDREPRVISRILTHIWICNVRESEKNLRHVLFTNTISKWVIYIHPVTNVNRPKQVNDFSQIRNHPMNTRVYMDAKYWITIFHSTYKVEQPKNTVRTTFLPLQLRIHLPDTHENRW